MTGPLTTTEFYPGTVLLWTVTIQPAQQGTSLWEGSMLTVGASANSGGPRSGAPLTVKLTVEYAAAAAGQIVTFQRGIGPLVNAAAPSGAGVTTMTLPVGPGVFPPGLQETPIMVGEPIVLRVTGAAVPALQEVTVCAVVVWP
jgi:hypothetical protein